MTRALSRVVPLDSALDLRYESSTSRRSIDINSLGFKVFPKSTVRLDGEMIFMWVTLRSISSDGMLNSSSIQRGMAPPQGLAASGLRSNKNVSMPPKARASAVEEPAGPPPMTAARSLRPEMDLHLTVKVVGFERLFCLVFRVGGSEVKREWRGWVWAAIFLFGVWKVGLF